VYAPFGNTPLELLISFPRFKRKLVFGDAILERHNFQDIIRVWGCKLERHIVQDTIRVWGAIFGKECVLYIPIHCT